ncbi:MAG: transposase [Sphaerochaeta sp.]|nr:transposase [Sphaerochaeta sp.]
MYQKFSVPIPAFVGKITRKKSPDGSIYLYLEIDRIYHKEKGYTIPKRVCIGKQDPMDSTRMFPNQKYFDYLPSESAANTPEYSGSRSSCLHAGTHVVVGRFLEKYRILDWLQGRFGPKNGGLVMDLAIYLIITEGNAAQHYPDHAYHHPLFTPQMRIYSDSKVGALLKETISRDDTIAFTEWWNSQRDHRNKVYMSYDSTNKLCQAGDIDMVEGGHAKDGHDGDHIFNVAIATDVRERLPVFYEEYLGSIVDVTQLVCMVDKAWALGYRNLGFILDRGYFSKANITYMDSNRFSFIIMVKGKKSLVSSIVLSVRGSFENKRSNYIWEYSVSGTTVEGKLYEGDSRPRSFHVFYSAYNNAKERQDLELRLRKLSCELDSLLGKDCADLNLGKFEEFYSLEFSSEGKKKKILVMYSEKAGIIEAMIDLFGYFCIISSDRMTARDALLLYKGRDSSEKLFAADKTFLGSRAERVRSEESLRSKLFIEFLALIIRSRFYACISDHVHATRTRRNYLNVVSVIKELEKIELIRIGDGVYRLDHAITARQKEILSIFGMSDDDMRAECRSISNELVTIDAGDIRSCPKDDEIRDDSTVEDEEERQCQE